MQRFARVPGVRVDAVGEGWVAFSPASCGTYVLNNECAAVLEVLESGPQDAAAIADVLSADVQVEAQHLAPIIGTCWPYLRRSGLVHPV